MATATTRPTIAFAMGDPAGISPELAAKVLALPEVRLAAQLLVFGDRRILNEGARVAQTAVDVCVVEDEGAAMRAQDGPVLVDLGNLAPTEVERGKPTLAGGRFATENFRRALLAAKAGRADAVFFTPFNKAAMRMAYPAYDDEIRFINDVLGKAYPASEFNVLDRLWNARVTSHVPLSEVASRITGERIERALRLTDGCMRAAGFERPRIGVAGLNPHAGEGGLFGSEEVEIIAPAIVAARAEGIDAHGPFAPDTVFMRARGGEFDVVVAMYHDQGLIPVKYLGVEKGVNVTLGLPLVRTSPDHGTAFDIAGTGRADASSLIEAVRMARSLLVGAAAREDA
jgi:4-hydroxythreonine-4-phosphate dehydrogenase